MDEKDRMIQELRQKLIDTERLVQERNGEKAVLIEKVKALEWKNRMLEMKREELGMKVERISDELTVTRRKLVALVESLEEMAENNQQGLDAMKKMQEALTLR